MCTEREKILYKTFEKFIYIAIWEFEAMQNKYIGLSGNFNFYVILYSPILY